MNSYVNIRFDTVSGPIFAYGKIGGDRKLIGERQGDYVVQFSSVARAKRAIKAYRNYLSVPRDGHYALPGEYEGITEKKWLELKECFFGRRCDE